MGEHVKFCFVILNYNTYDYTIECINSIKDKCEKEDYRIIIVDNYSPDKSGIKLKEYYENNKCVDVILNDENCGFAKGNNVGIKYAREKYESDFIIVNNSDTILLTNNFSDEILKSYDRYKFAIMGPKVHNVNNNVQYIPKKMLNQKQIRNTIISFYIRYFLNLFYLTKLDEKYFQKQIPISINNPDTNVIYKDVVIHGCFFILSKDYFMHYEGIPEDSSFYREEDFLYLNCKESNLLTIYDPVLEIFHNVNGSIKSSYTDLRKRNIFKYKRHIKANKILLKKMKKMGEGL